jgi:hypothetical protein
MAPPPAVVVIPSKAKANLSRSNDIRPDGLLRVKHAARPGAAIIRAASPDQAGCSVYILLLNLRMAYSVDGDPGSATFLDPMSASIAASNSAFLYGFAT